MNNFGCKILFSLLLGLFLSSSANAQSTIGYRGFNLPVPFSVGGTPFHFGIPRGGSFTGIPVPSNIVHGSFIPRGRGFGAFGGGFGGRVIPPYFTSPYYQGGGGVPQYYRSPHYRPAEVSAYHVSPSSRPVEVSAYHASPSSRPVEVSAYHASPNYRPSGDVPAYFRSPNYRPPGSELPAYYRSPHYVPGQ